MYILDRHGYGIRYGGQETNQSFLSKAKEMLLGTILPKALRLAGPVISSVTDTAFGLLLPKAEIDEQTKKPRELTTGEKFKEGAITTGKTASKGLINTILESFAKKLEDEHKPPAKPPAKPTGEKPGEKPPARPRAPAKKTGNGKIRRRKMDSLADMVGTGLSPLN